MSSRRFRSLRVGAVLPVLVIVAAMMSCFWLAGLFGVAVAAMSMAIPAALVLGFFAFLALSAVVLVAASVIAIRSWWLGRNIPPAANAPPSADGDLIEGEFHVVKKDKTS